MSGHRRCILHWSYTNISKEAPNPKCNRPQATTLFWIDDDSRLTRRYLVTFSSPGIYATIVSPVAKNYLGPLQYNYKVLHDAVIIYSLL